MPVEYFSAYISYETMTRGIFYQDNSDCVKEMINGRYWLAQVKTMKVNENVSLAGIYTILAICSAVVIAIIGFLGIRWLRRKNEEEGDDVKRSGSEGTENLAESNAKETP